MALLIKLVIAVIMSVIAWRLFPDLMDSAEGIVLYAVFTAMLMSAEQGTGKIIRALVGICCALLVYSLLGWMALLTKFTLIACLVIGISLLPYSARAMLAPFIQLMLLTILLACVAMSIATVFFDWQGYARLIPTLSHHADLWPYFALLLFTFLMLLWGRRV